MMLSRPLLGQTEVQSEPEVFKLEVSCIFLRVNLMVPWSCLCWLYSFTTISTVERIAITVQLLERLFWRWIWHSCRGDSCSLNWPFLQVSLWWSREQFLTGKTIIPPTVFLQKPTWKVNSNVTRWLKDLTSGIFFPCQWHATRTCLFHPATKYWYFKLAELLMMTLFKIL